MKEFSVIIFKYKNRKPTQLWDPFETQFPGTQTSPWLFSVPLE
jgi:hypothetical protein